ncbi:MAG: tRNA threonylcarbamoyladenosine dehydratase [Lentisphaerae bacterium]|nr:tRNA threonylcarbamoyladenosine dehydratase [Lentisphaerota bacterium]
MKRFARTEILLGQPALTRLASARVAVFGLGGVGSYTVEALARSGIGHIRLIDIDVVSYPNFNRQLFALESTLDKPKVEVAVNRIKDINPDCTVEAHQVFSDSETCLELLGGKLDVVVDAIDSLTPKIELLAKSVEIGIPTISCMGASSRTDPLKIKIGDISETYSCPLAKFVRKRLKKKGITTGITCVFSDEDVVTPEISEVNPDENEPQIGRRRPPLGSLSYMTGIFGLIAAREVLKVLLPDELL